MKYENIKTVILTVLVCLSGVLTWSIWTFQPNYETVDNHDKTVNKVAIGSERDVRKVVRPNHVIYHSKGNIYGTSNNSQVDAVVSVINKWKYYEVRKTDATYEDLSRLLSKGEAAEIIFPDEVPVELYKKVLTFEDQNLPKFEFDRIIVDSDAPGKQEGTVYFYSSKGKQTYLANISIASLNEFTARFFEDEDKLPEYFPHTFKDGTVTYLPSGPTDMIKYTYYPNPIDSESLKEGLFRNPNFVQKSIVADVEEYSDEASKLTVDNQTNMIYYVNPFRENDAVIGTTNLIQKSIEFINDHSGWTDQYRYVYKDDFNQRVVFRIYSKEGYPIFNQLGLSEILEVWGQNDISRYIRPNFHLELPLNPEKDTVQLPSGQEALAILKQKAGIKPELIKGISLGYYMNNNVHDSSLIYLEPGWFYNYDGVWRELQIGGEVR